jgi:hypothetical protein
VPLDAPVAAVTVGVALLSDPSAYNPNVRSVVDVEYCRENAKV